MEIMGFRIVESDFLGDWKQVRFPKSRKRRIRKKWRKRQSNWLFVQSREVMVDEFNRNIYCSPRTATKIRLGCEQRQQEMSNA